MEEGELNNLKEGKLDQVGYLCDKDTSDQLSNSHKYLEGERYLHFFKNKKDVDYARDLYRNKNGKYYVCEFDLSPLTLLKHVGWGLYEVPGYDCDGVKVTEFAIPSTEIKTEFLINSELDAIHDKENVK